LEREKDTYGGAGDLHVSKNIFERKKFEVSQLSQASIAP
jgi:hypothetical protein